VARRATVIRQEQSASQHTLILDAGNSLVGDAQPALRTRGRTSVEAMNLMGYDAMALGLQDVSILGLSALSERIDEASFAVLSANAYLAGTDQLVAAPYLLVTVADHRVAILGLTDRGTTQEVVATDPVAAASEWLPELRPLADIIIVLSHAGLEADQAIASQVPGIDLIVSGRNPEARRPIFSEAYGTILLHAGYTSPGYAGTKVGVAHLSFDRRGALMEYEWAAPSLSDQYDDDPEVAAWVQTAIEQDAAGCQ